MNNEIDPVQECERAAISDENGPKQHARLLTEAEWASIMPPFYYIKVSFDTWTQLEYDIALKFILRNGTGWVFYRDKKFIFEREEDYVLFRMWASEKPMVEKDSIAIR